MRSHVAIIVIFLSGCSGDEGTPSASTEPGNDPSPECAAYLSCLEATGSSDLEGEDEAYGRQSRCWEDAARGLGCTSECETALSATRAAVPTLSTCWAGDGFPTAEVFATMGAVWWVDDLTDPKDCNSFGFRRAVVRVDLVGTEGPAFELYAAETQQTDIVFEADCTLDEGATFTCVGRKNTYEIYGEFDDLFDTMTLHVDRTFEGKPRPCTLTAEPTA